MTLPLPTHFLPDLLDANLRADMKHWPDLDQAEPDQGVGVLISYTIRPNTIITNRRGLFLQSGAPVSAPLERLEKRTRVALSGVCGERVIDFIKNQDPFTQNHEAQLVLAKGFGLLIRSGTGRLVRHLWKTAAPMDEAYTQISPYLCALWPLAPSAHARLAIQPLCAPAERWAGCLFSSPPETPIFKIDRSGEK